MDKKFSTISEKLLNYGIKNVSDYVENGSWLSKKNHHRNKGFDIFEDVTEWPDKLSLSGGEWSLNVINKKQSKYPTFLDKNNISTDMALKNNGQILWKHGRCLSFEPAEPVRLYCSS